MVIQHNLPGLNSKRLYNKNNSKLAKSLEKLSSGYAINRAGDNAAGLAVSEKMRSQICGMQQAVKNSLDGVSLVQTFEGALGETVAIIHRMKTLADQAANGTYDNEIDRVAIHTEFQSLCGELDQIADTDFNGLIMLNGRCMADHITFLTESGIKWLTPTDVEFNKNSFVSTFKPVEGFPEVTMSIELLPDAKDKLIGDKELAEAFGILNNARVRSFYSNGIPAFSLEGLTDEERSRFIIETNGSEAIISTVTSQSGKVDIARVTCTELPHYASTSAVGKWYSSSSIATGTWGQLDPTAPGNDKYDLSKWVESYVNQTNSQGVTRAEREAYLQWIKDTGSHYARLVPDEQFDHDTDSLKFTWDVNGGMDFENEVDENGKPITPSRGTGNKLPIYDDNYNGGPQIYLEDVYFRYNDEDMKAGAYLHVGVTNRSYTVTGTNDTRASFSMTAAKCTDYWLEYGNVQLTVTYNAATGLWEDNFGGSGTASDYGMSYSPYSRTNTLYPKNLQNFCDENGNPPDGYTFSFTLNCPSYRSFTSSGYIYGQDRVHNGQSQYGTNITDFKMDEYDPANPDIGGVDYRVAKDGASYRYDGVDDVWRDDEGNAVKLEDVGIYLPKNPYQTELSPLHDGMTITVSNPTMVGEDYIEAKIDLIDIDRSANAFRRVYDNVTYTENLILQVGARTKDAVNFTFSYSSNGIGDLEADLNCTAKGLGIDKLILLEQESANYAIDKLDHAANKVSMIRATFGAIQNRLEHKIDNLNVSIENLTSAESLIRDTDMPTEMMNFTKNQILAQASQSMLAQANALPQQIMSLLNQ